MNINQRSDVDALLEKVAVALASEGCRTAPELRTPTAPKADRKRYELLLACSERIPRRDRKAHLRSACVWLGDAFEALADGHNGGAYWLAEKASGELDEYRGVRPSWDVDAGWEQIGGAA
jgi:hypothetical protein